MYRTKNGYVDSNGAYLGATMWQAKVALESRRAAAHVMSIGEQWRSA